MKPLQSLPTRLLSGSVAILAACVCHASGPHDPHVASGPYFVVPGVVGPRYGGDAGASRQETAWLGNPTLLPEAAAAEA